MSNVTEKVLLGRACFLTSDLVTETMHSLVPPTI